MQESGYEYVGQSKGNPVLHHRTATGALEPVTKKAAQVDDQLTALEYAIQRLSKLTAEMEQKLSPVTRQQEPCNDSGCCPEENLVPVADTIRASKKRVAWIADRLEDLYHRIEL